MAENSGWLFVNDVPLLYEKKRVARQMQIETWLDLTLLLRELKIADGEIRNALSNMSRGYVV